MNKYHKNSLLYNLLFILILCCFANNVAAQSIYGSQEAEIRAKDAINNDSTEKLGHLRLDRLAKQQIMNDPFEKRIGLNGNGDWTLLDNNMKRNSPTQRQAPKQSSRKLAEAKRKAKRDARRANFFDYRQQQMAEARERARLKKEEEQRKFRERVAKGMATYNTNMTGLRAEHVQRDQQKFQQGLALDKAVKAEDYYNMPENSNSSQALADALNDEPEKKEEDSEKGRIQLHIIDHTAGHYERQSGLALDSSNGGECELYNGGNYNEAEVQKWDDLFNEDKALVVGKEKNPVLNRNLDKELKIESSFIPVDSLNVTTLRGEGCIALKADSILFLNDSALSVSKWKAPVTDVDNVINVGKHIIAKQGNQLIEIIDDRYEVICTFDVGYFDICPGGGETVLVYCCFDDVFVIHRVNIKMKKYDELLRVPYAISKVAYSEQTGKIYAVVNDERIVIVDKVPENLYISDTFINDICIINEGMLIATDKAILYLDLRKNKLYTYQNYGAHQIWFDGHTINATDSNGDYIEITNNTKRKK